MHEIEPHQARRRLGGIAHGVVVIGPDNGEAAHGVAQPGGSERQQGLEGRKLRWSQLQDEHGYEDSEHAVGECAQSFRGGSREHAHIIHLSGLVVDAVFCELVSVE
jgi:hypothetical protein